MALCDGSGLDGFDGSGWRLLFRSTDGGLSSAASDGSAMTAPAAPDEGSGSLTAPLLAAALAARHQRSMSAALAYEAAAALAAASAARHLRSMSASRAYEAVAALAAA